MFRTALKRIGLALLLIAVFAAGWVTGLASRPRSGEPAAAELSRAVDLPPLKVPVAGLNARNIENNWHDARGGGARKHEGIDMMAPGGTPVLAAQAGTVEKLFESRLGGTTLYLRSNDGRWMSYYAHLSGYAGGIAEGSRVRAGQPIALVGDTGDAGPGNFHLHFALNHMAPGERWWQGTPVNPYPSLAAAR